MTGLDRLLRPSSIAVIGGGAWCANVIDQCRRIGFSGDIWPVHPTKSQIAGLPTIATIDRLPSPPDAAFVGINREGTVEAVRALSVLGAGGAVCFASGFREAEAETRDGATLQDALLDAAGEMTILGPNCYGFLNYLDGAALWPDQHGGVRVETGVALVTQSSNIAINLTMQGRGLPLAYVVTAGNQAQTGVSAISRALIRDERVTALGLHVEGFDDLRGIEALAHEARSLGKPVVVLKVGRSDQARIATVSHTASLAGSDAGADALLARMGFGRARSLPVLLETLKLLHVAGPLSSNRIASMSCSGGEASLVADTAQGSGLEFPPLDATQSADLRTALGPKVALANPLDYHTYIWGDEDKLTACFTAMMQGDLGMGMVVLDFPRPDRCDASAWEPVIAAVTRAKATTGKPMAIVASLKETMPETYAERLTAAGIVPFCGLEEAVAAMAIAATLGQTRGDVVPLLMPPPPAAGVVLDEAEAKARLADARPACPRLRSRRNAGGGGRGRHEAGLSRGAQGTRHRPQDRSGRSGRCPDGCDGRPRSRDRHARLGLPRRADGDGRRRRASGGHRRGPCTWLRPDPRSGRHADRTDRRPHVSPRPRKPTIGAHSAEQLAHRPPPARLPRPSRRRHGRRSSTLSWRCRPMSRPRARRKSKSTR